MSDVVAQTAMCQCDKGGMHKLVVMVSPATGDSQSLSANGNCLLVPQGTPCSLLYGAPCPMVVNIVSKEGQSLVELSGSKALGADCEFMCPMGGKLTAQAHGQAIALHNEASAGLQIVSLIADFVPIVCTIKSVIEVVTGVDPITGEATSRLAAAAGIVPGGKAVTKGGKVVKAMMKGEKGAAKVAKAAAKTEKAAASSAKAASKGEKAAAKNSNRVAQPSNKAANDNNFHPKAANDNNFHPKAANDNNFQPKSANDPNFQPHPVKTKPLNKKERVEYKQKAEKRQLTKEEYKRLDAEKRLKASRNDGVDKAWDLEQERVINNQPTKRQWEPHQVEDLRQGKIPKDSAGGKTMQGHHKYSVRQYPQHANNPENVEFLTPKEHHQAHGNNWRTPTHGKAVNSK